ncbi:MAG TPA: hypothetical protein VMR50_06590 [Myxococcota bacterium]|nr:hypothetical protein [Myxococcota bacterium]
MLLALGCAPPPPPKPPGTVETLSCHSEVVHQERPGFAGGVRTDTVEKCVPRDVQVPPAGTQVPPTRPDPNATPDTP